MSGISMEPDEHMKWIYDYANPAYMSEEAIELRELRRRAIQSASRYMLEEAYINDQRKENE